MNKKGFTLIELLAVIVILAVISLIVTPIVTNIISTAKDGALKESGNQIVSMAKTYYNNPLIENKLKTIDLSSDTLEYSGKRYNGLLTLSDDGNVEFYFIDGINCVIKKFNSDIEIIKNTNNCDDNLLVPSEYTKLNYLESTGTQYIDTGYILSSDDRVVLDFAKTQPGGFLFGGRAASTYKNFNIYSPNYQIRYDYFGTGVFMSINLTQNTRYTLDFNREKLLLNNEIQYTADVINPVQSTDYNCYLFQVNYHLTASLLSTYPTYMRVYSFKIYDKNDNIVRDLIPVKNSTNVYGMYDKANGIFYTNLGTGTFIAG